MKAKRKIYDSVFTALFSEPKYQLMLYRELHPEDEDVREEDITNVTLEAILTNSVYNDLGFTARDHTVFLIEAQSTWCPNMTLRTLIYLAETYKKHILDTKQNYYSEKVVSIPKPEIYVLYTGDAPHAEDELSLADTFFDGDDSCIDVKAKVIYGDQSDSILSQYATFTSIYKRMRKEYGGTQEAVLATIEECASRNILQEFFEERRTEVVDIMMALFDKDINLQMYANSERTEGFTEGHNLGLAKGINIGRAEMIDMIMQNTGKDLAYVCNQAGMPMEEYYEAKAAKNEFDNQEN